MKYLIAFVLILFPIAGFPSYTIRHGKLVDRDSLPSESPQEHYQGMIAAYEKKEWKELVRQATILSKYFKSTPFSEEAAFFLGVGHLNLEDYEFANNQFSAYLKQQVAPKHFEEAIQYKFTIAEKFHQGEKKHLFAMESMPQWLPAKEEALAIYEEVITALPHHDLAAQSYFGKAKLLLENEDYRASIETYQMLIRRFPKHPLAVESYIGIENVYLHQCKNEFPDPDLLDLAEINLRKFKENFPSEERYAVAEESFSRMREHYAKNLYETAQFYQKTKKNKAAVIYYKKILGKYPETFVAKESKKRLEILEKKIASQTTESATK
ncbi:MAG TPA: outer membrane protein assembly factor BamD [Rhabdochlamydiaceae bacterium]|nr:outer membrane protein assembly factor BamD [Rhabdochlamydiaceae bacterium]